MSKMISLYKQLCYNSRQAKVFASVEGGKLHEAKITVYTE